MSSMTNSRMNCRPLWMRKVWPTNSGTMVQSRAHVLIGSRAPPRFCFVTFSNSRSSTNGPFFSERLMFLYPSREGSIVGLSPRHGQRRRTPPPGSLGRVVRAGTATTNDRRVGRLPLIACLAALGQHAGRTARMTPAGSAALAATHRVTHRVHRRAAVVRLATQPALAARLAEADVHVVGVADGADGRPARRADAAHLARWQRDLRPLPLSGGQGRRRSGGAAQLSAVAGLHLQVVDRHAERDLPQWQTVTDARLGVLAADDLVAGGQSGGGEDIRLGAVLVLEQGDASRAIG